LKIRLCLAAVAGWILASSPGAWAAAFATTYVFSGGSDGAQPEVIIADKGALYIATGGGYPNNGVLVEYQIATGRLTTLHIFAATTRQGMRPEGTVPSSLILVHGVLYGTMAAGGPLNGGTVFSFDLKTGAFSTVYSFDGTTNGAYPGSLVALGGDIYGATDAGGPANSGTLFKFDPSSSTGSVIYSFTNGQDGAGPGSLVVVGSQLFGTSLNASGARDGLIFGFDPASGNETTHYEFSGPDGAFPQSLKLHDGLIYGFTTNGGSANAGVAFSLDPATNTARVLHDFAGRTAACNGFTTPVFKGNRLYSAGGNCGSKGLGDVFSLVASNGKPSVLYNFKGNTDGHNPSGLVQWKGVLYGITTYSGPNYTGTIFSVTP
jgi:uncharacterized repeat protein (TIGR03803 family)